MAMAGTRKWPNPEPWYTEKEVLLRGEKAL